MLNRNDENKFNDMMELENEKIAGQPDGHEGEPIYETMNQPKHYDFFDTKVITIIEKTLSWEEYMGFLKGNALKYRLRLGSKPNVPIYQDLKKAKWYESEYQRIISLNTPRG